MEICGYCCNLKCFVVPRDHVDGMACKICKSYCYCRCRCITYKTNAVKSALADAASVDAKSFL